MLQYAEKNDDLTAGLVVAAIGACRDLNDWQGAYQIYNTVKVPAIWYVTKIIENENICCDDIW